ncbi:hypothetical protein [Escherichia coli]|uniref:hypothetical protein n=1 Tax=Escherichia coli TaxID=562 RepID=UPI003F497D15
MMLNYVNCAVCHCCADLQCFSMSFVVNEADMRAQQHPHEQQAAVRWRCAW